jgi:hypothetical protein
MAVGPGTGTFRGVVDRHGGTRSAAHACASGAAYQNVFAPPRCRCPTPRDLYSRTQVDLLINSSGAKLRPLHNLTLEAAPGGESARGIWSSLHAADKGAGAEAAKSAAGGYRI